MDSKCILLIRLQHFRTDVVSSLCFPIMLGFNCLSCVISSRLISRSTAASIMSVSMGGSTRLRTCWKCCIPLFIFRHCGELSIYIFQWIVLVWTCVSPFRVMVILYSYFVPFNRAASSVSCARFPLEVCALHHLIV